MSRPQSDVLESEKPQLPGTRISPPSFSKGTGGAESERLGRELLRDQDAAEVQYELPRQDLSSDAIQQRERRARKTDSEISEFEGGLGSRYDAELGSLEREMGLDNPIRDRDLPSLTVGIQRAQVLFRRRQFTDALILTNELLDFYPRSPQLLMMKGTLHQKLGQQDLALAAYQAAFDLRPQKKLKAQIQYLQLKLKQRDQLRTPIKGEVVAEGVHSIKYIQSPGARPLDKAVSGPAGSGSKTPGSESDPMQLDESSTQAQGSDVGVDDGADENFGRDVQEDEE